MIHVLSHTLERNDKNYFNSIVGQVNSFFTESNGDKSLPFLCTNHTEAEQN